MEKASHQEYHMRDIIKIVKMLASVACIFLALLATQEGARQALGAINVYHATAIAVFFALIVVVLSCATVLVVLSDIRDERP